MGGDLNFEDDTSGQVAHRLHESSERLRAIVEGEEDAIFVKDRALRYVDVNPSMERLFGRTADDLLGCTDADLFGEEAAERIRQVDLRVLGGEVVEQEHTRPFGGSDRTFHIVKIPLRDEQGAVTGLCGIARDVTAHRQAEAGLRLSEERYRRLVEASADPIYTLTREGIVLSANRAAAWILGLEPEAIVGARLDRLLPEADAADLQRDVDHVVESGEPLCALEGEFGTAAGPRWFNNTLTPIHGDGGGVACVLGIARDVTDRRRVEEALRESEEEYRLLFENVHDVVCVLDPELRLVRVSPSVEQVLGYRPAELVGRTVAEAGIVAPVSLEALARDAAAVLAGAHVPLTSYDLLARDGTIRTVEVNGEPFVRDGAVLGIIAVARDVSDRLAAQAALRESEEKYRHLFANVTDVVYAFDTELRILSISPSVERILGYTPDEIVGRRFQDIELVSPDYTGAVHIDAARALAGERVESSTYEFVAKDGARRYGEVSIAPLVRDGGFVAAVAVARDITDRVETEHALRESESNYRAIFDGAREGIVVIDPDTGAILDVNAMICELFGYRREEFRLLSLGDLSQGQPPFSEAEALERVRRAAAGQPQLFEWLARARDGRCFWNEVSLHRATIGGVERLLAFARDIDERKQLEGQMRRLQKLDAIGRLAGGIAHDFNNTLTALDGYADLALVHLDPTHPAAAELDEIRGLVRRAAGLTRQLLAFSRRQILQPVPLYLNDVVRGMEGMLRRLLGEHIGLVCTLDPNLGTIEADPGQLEQVILNLAVNAHDAMPDGGSLSLETTNVDLGPERAPIGVEPGPYVALTIRDTGCGMDPETRSHIFEPFFTTKPAGEGTGLGLATVYGIVTQSGGHIQVDSEPGRGTTIHVCLPRSHGSVEAEAEPSRTPAPQARGETVLVVEDDAGVRDTIRSTLTRLGYTVLEAADPADALRLCGTREGAIGLVICDLVLPEVRGPELAERLTALRPTLRVLYISGYSDGAAPGGTPLPHGAPFLERPFSADSLAHKVAALLAPSQDV